MILLLEVADYISSHMQHVPQEYLAQARQGEIKYHLEQTKKKLAITVTTIKEKQDSLAFFIIQVLATLLRNN